MTARYAVPNPVAPWAEVMPHTPPMTTDDLHRIPDDGWTYELVQGVLVRLPMSSGEASSIGSRLLARLGVYVEDHALGRVTGEQGGYRLDPLRPRETEVAPDIGFVQAARVPPRASPDYSTAWPLAPDLAVEVASENQFAPGLMEKACLYLAFGTRLVWVIWPRYERVDVWRPGDEAPAVLGRDDVLDGEDVVPGFTYLVAILFA